MSALEYNKTAEVKLNVNKFAAAGPNSGYRDLESQRELREKYEKGIGNYVVEPGTSRHGWGLAIDMCLNDPGTEGKGKGYATTPEVKWLELNGWKFGFTGFSEKSKKGPYYSETWHWNYYKFE